MTRHRSARRGRPGTRPTGVLRIALAGRGAAIASVAVAQVLALGAGLAQPLFNAHLIDNGVVAGDFGYILGLGVWMLVVAVVGSVASFATVALGSRVSAEAAAEIRRRVYRRAGQMTEAEFQRIGTGSMLTRTSPDIAVVAQSVFVTLTAAIAAPIVMIGAIILALRESVTLSLVIVVVVVVLGIGVGLFVVRTIPLAMRMQQTTDALNRVLREHSAGVRIVRAFRRESTVGGWFAESNTEMSILARRIGSLQGLLTPAVLLVANLASVATVVAAAGLIESGRFTIGGLTAYTGYLNQIVAGTTMLVATIAVIPRAQASLRRIAEVLDADDVPTMDDASPGDVAERPMRLGFRVVHLRYPTADDETLRGLSLECVPGGTTVVIGGTSSGKSTMLSLVPRLIDPTVGAVAVAGKRVTEWPLEDLRRQIVHVGQRQSLIAGTVGANLRLADADADDDSLWRAMHATLIADTVRDRGGLDAAVDQGGANFSGGQRQRLALARALLRRPAVLCLDDAFSAMDGETASAVLAGIRTVLPDATVLLATQRVNLTRDADRIAVLEHGRITAVGDHLTLQASSEAYREFVDAQSAGVRDR
ncbi:ABC transporter ATP-binding protein [Gordonia zhaorongruii]|uniref:ABC transporter ATP-binding protein n=1 Tax=Gordonia zhaorongruii TaxID=2597659 RepID=UPI001F4361D1|nr:ABC transporter ATP-binding protein [Gordonia zhaorongruii]